MVGLSFDGARVEAGLRKFIRNIDASLQRTGYEHAQRSAEQIKGETPVLTGRLAHTVGATRTAVGGDVHYGGALPYARKINRHTHAVEHAMSSAPSAFRQVMIAAAEQEISRL